jgi:hypothetical protein
MMKVMQEDFNALAERVDRELSLIKELPEDARRRAMELKKAIEAFHEHGLRKLVRTFRETDAGKELLLKAVEDPAVYAMLFMHGICLPVWLRCSKRCARTCALTAAMWSW